MSAKASTKTISKDGVVYCCKGDDVISASGQISGYNFSANLKRADDSDTFDCTCAKLARADLDANVKEMVNKYFPDSDN